MDDQNRRRHGVQHGPKRVSAAPTQGAVKIWHLQKNEGSWDHPIHIHFEEGQILKHNGLAPPEWEKWARKDVYRLGASTNSSLSIDVALRFGDRAAEEQPQVLANLLNGYIRNRGLADAATSQGYAKAGRIAEVSDGERLFATRCSTCHTIGAGDGLRPDLMGITARRSQARIGQPDRMVKAHDAATTTLVKVCGAFRCRNSASPS